MTITEGTCILQGADVNLLCDKFGRVEGKHVFDLRVPVTDLKSFLVTTVQFSTVLQMPEIYDFSNRFLCFRRDSKVLGHQGGDWVSF